jgi:hypothetical protein
MQQTVDVSSAAAAINDGGVTYNLSGNLGGWSDQTDDADVVATFENASGASLGTATLSSVTDLDRLFTTEFLPRSASGTVPEGTTKILVTVNFYYGEGDTTDGYLNSLNLALDTPVTSPVRTPPASDVPQRL